MNQKGFIKKIIDLYIQAREVEFPDDKINRGRSKSISSQAEDLFAFFVAQKIEIDHIYIDQPISLQNNGQNKTKYPDILLVKNGKIISLFDIKTDIGWNRDGLFNMCQQHNNFIENIKGKECSMRNGKTKERLKYSLDKNLKYNIVIITDMNISHKKLYDQIKQAEIFESNINVFVLSSGIHPNEYLSSSEDVLSRVIIRKDFDDLEYYLKNL